MEKSINYSHSILTADCHQNIFTLCELCRLFQRTDINNFSTY